MGPVLQLALEQVVEVGHLGVQVILDLGEQVFDKVHHTGPLEVKLVLEGHRPLTLACPTQ